MADVPNRLRVWSLASLPGCCKMPAALDYVPHRRNHPPRGEDRRRDREAWRLVVETSTSDEKEKAIGADTAASEREIVERVYRLYGLTAEEIKIVEEASK